MVVELLHQDRPGQLLTCSDLGGANHSLFSQPLQPAVFCIKVNTILTYTKDDMVIKSQGERWHGFCRTGAE